MIINSESLGKWVDKARLLESKDQLCSEDYFVLCTYLRSVRAELTTILSDFQELQLTRIDKCGAINDPDT